MGKTSISWTGTIGPDGQWHDGYSFNPWWGCTKISEGCANCYAESLASRFGYDCFGDQPRKLMTDAYWRKPMHWDRQAERLGIRLKVFAGSMCDIFEDHVPMDQFLRLIDVVRATPHLDWLFCTKRIENVETWLLTPSTELPRNVWLGTTAENQQRWDERVPVLLRCREIVPTIPVLWVSVEPMLTAINATKIQLDPFTRTNPLTGSTCGCTDNIGAVTCWQGDNIDWVVCGEESGHGARPVGMDAIRNLRDQCVNTGTPFFLKQMWEDGTLYKEPYLDNDQWLQFPEVQ